ncbi:UNVERIFIED_CONTAM: hypothetical protein RMT77_006371 [Armadillidium vulgare]
MTPYLKVSNLLQYEFTDNKSQQSTSPPKDDFKNKKDFSTQKTARKLKFSEVNCTMKAEMTQFNISSPNELQGSLKQQVSFARTWVKRHIVPSRDATLSFCVILIAYHHFCKENDILPLKPDDLLQVLHSSLDSDKSSCLDDQSLKTSEINQGQSLKTSEINQGQSLKTSEINQHQSLKTSEINQGQSLKTSEINQGQSLKTSEINQGQRLKTSEITKFQSLKTSEINQDQSLKTSEISQEYLSNLNELKLEASNDEDQTIQDDFRNLPNLSFKCDFIKIEPDDAYESDLSDSDMKEIGTGDYISEFKSQEEIDSSYESFDETSSDSTSLHVVQKGRDFATEPEIITSRTTTVKYSINLDVSQVIDASKTQKVSRQTQETFVRAKRPISNEDDSHNILLPPPKKVKWSEEQRKVIVNMKGLLEFHLQNYKESECYTHAKSLSETLLEMLKRKQLKYFLQEFGHAMSCGEEHGSLCFMFKRLVNHILHAKHECALKNMYGHILRLHLDTCNENQCGFPNCKLRREERQERVKQQELKKALNVNIRVWIKVSGSFAS